MQFQVMLGGEKHVFALFFTVGAFKQAFYVRFWKSSANRQFCVLPIF